MYQPPAEQDGQRVERLIDDDADFEMQAVEGVPAAAGGGSGRSRAGSGDDDSSGTRPRATRCCGIFSLRPAEKSCFNCLDIGKGAQLVSMYLMIQGFMALFSLFATPKLDPHLTDLSLSLMYCQEAFRVFSLLYGMKGLSGCNLRLSKPLREMLTFLLLYTIFSLLQLTRLFVVCDEMRDVKDLTCSQVQSALTVFVGIEYTIYAYMSYIVWSYAVKLENSPDAMLLPRFLDPDHMREQATEANAPRVMPTDQTPHTLGDNRPQAGSTVEAFSGEAYRLD